MAFTKNRKLPPFPLIERNGDLSPREVGGYVFCVAATPNIYAGIPRADVERSMVPIANLVDNIESQAASCIARKMLL